MALPVRVMIAAAIGAVVGSIVSGLWWMHRDRTTICVGGCTGENIPPGDITLLVGAVGGVLLATSVLCLVLMLGRREG
jgi:heme A synthase